MGTNCCFGDLCWFVYWPNSVQRFPVSSPPVGTHSSGRTLEGEGGWEALKLLSKLAQTAEQATYAHLYSPYLKAFLPGPTHLSSFLDWISCEASAYLLMQVGGQKLMSCANWPAAVSTTIQH